MARQFTSIMFALAFTFLLEMTGIQAQEVKSVDSFQLAETNGQLFNLNKHKDKKAVVVFFTSSNCVFATRYVERMNGLYDSFKDKAVTFVAINSNDANLSQRDDEAIMRQYAPFPFPYLKDKSQEVAKAFGAKINPEVFILTPKNGKFHVAYHGAFDDNILEKAVTKKYAQQAIESLLQGQEPQTKTVEGKGCDIRWAE